MPLNLGPTYKNHFLGNNVHKKKLDLIKQIYELSLKVNHISNHYICEYMDDLSFDIQKFTILLKEFHNMRYSIDLHNLDKTFKDINIITFNNTIDIIMFNLEKTNVKQLKKIHSKDF